MDRNKLTLTIISLAQRLVDFGAFATIAELKKLLIPMMKMTNSTRDVSSRFDDV
jgi:hypothetical protein